MEIGKLEEINALHTIDYEKIAEVHKKTSGTIDGIITDGSQIAKIGNKKNIET